MEGAAELGFVMAAGDGVFMHGRNFRRAWLLMVLAAAGLWAQAPPGASYIPDDICAACHSEITQPFPRNPHFVANALGNRPPEQTGCQSCHGPASEHVANSGDKTKINAFSLMAPEAALDNCLGCHSKDFGKMQIRRSSHSQGEVSCGSCHRVHTPGQIHRLLAKPERQVCYDCHLDVAARFSLPFNHPVNEGAMECSDCHNPHGAPVATWSAGQSPRMVDHSLGNDVPCVKCHTDKRGPFVFEHAPVRVEGCAQCHNPHGSTNPRLLARPAVFTMCLECHNSVMGFGTRGDGIASPGTFFHNIADPQFQNCVTCHSRIHGSNADPMFRR